MSWNDEEQIELDFEPDEAAQDEDESEDGPARRARQPEGGFLEAAQLFEYLGTPGCYRTRPVLNGEE